MSTLLIRRGLGRKPKHWPPNHPCLLPVLVVVSNQSLRDTSPRIFSFSISSWKKNSTNPMSCEPHCKHQLCCALLTSRAFIPPSRWDKERERGIQRVICKPWKPDLDVLVQIAREWEIGVGGERTNSEALMLFGENNNSFKKYLAIPWRGMWVAEFWSASQILQEFQDIYSCPEFWLGSFKGSVSHEFWI